MKTTAGLDIVIDCVASFSSVNPFQIPSLKLNRFSDGSRHLPMTKALAYANIFVSLI